MQTNLSGTLDAQCLWLTIAVRHEYALDQRPIRALSRRTNREGKKKNYTILSPIDDFYYNTFLFSLLLFFFLFE